MSLEGVRGSMVSLLVPSSSSSKTGGWLSIGRESGDEARYGVPLTPLLQGGLIVEIVNACKRGVEDWVSGTA